MSESSHKSGRFDHLDSIRGVAAMAVVVFHCLFHIVKVRDPEGIGTRWFEGFHQWLDLGKLGVVLFFAMSGYVIPYSLLRARSRPVLGFAVSRVFRLYPLYWASILLSLVVLTRGATLDWSIVWVNFSMLQSFFGVQDLLGVYWTLQIEIVFYVVCAVLLATGQVRWLRTSLLALAGFLAVALVFAWIRGTTPHRMPVAMPLGLAVMFWGDLQRRALESVDAARWANRATLALSLLLLPICKLAYDNPASDESWVRYLITYLVGLWAFALWSRRPSWTSPSSAFLGRISYSMYLIHPVTMGLDLYVHEWMNPWVVSGIVVIITVLISWGTYLLVEQPAIAMGVRMRQRLGC